VCIDTSVQSDDARYIALDPSPGQQKKQEDSRISAPPKIPVSGQRQHMLFSSSFQQCPKSDFFLSFSLSFSPSQEIGLLPRAFVEIRKAPF
jgi:hypothetical protein